MATHRAMLGSNEPFDLYELNLPIAASIKRDGIRGETPNNYLYSREMKLIPNKQVQLYAEQIKLYNHVLSTEMYIHGLPFNEHATFIMTHDLASREHSNKIKALLRKQELTHNYYYYIQLPKEFKFYIFDVVKDLGYCDRIDWLKHDLPKHKSYELVDYRMCYTVDEINEYFDYAITNGYEGLVLRKPDGLYKHGRATKREGTFLKLKPILNLQAKCIGFTERLTNTNVSFTNELGFADKRNTVDGKSNTGIAASVITEYEGKELKITLTGTEEYRKYIFEHQDEFIGKDVQFKGMLYGSKALPRHPVFLQFM